MAWSALKIVVRRRLEVAGSRRRRRLGNEQEEAKEEEVEDSVLFYEAFIPHTPLLCPDGKQTHPDTCDSAEN